jgi:hypothetical protein
MGFVVNKKDGLTFNNGLEAGDCSYHHLRISFEIISKMTESKAGF